MPEFCAHHRWVSTSFLFPPTFSVAVSGIGIRMSSPPQRKWAERGVLRPESALLVALPTPGPGRRSRVGRDNRAVS